ncbi:MAG: heavy-metal-associated domain-containing protein [Chloroflexi bacterium]|nr:heavy-metal-associated domain-containing protein [Chloroflexota bacterium]
MIKKVFRVPEMYCSNCVIALEGLEDSLPGIKRVSASYHKQQMEVIFDETSISESRIIAAAHDLGFHPVPALQN